MSDSDAYDAEAGAVSLMTLHAAKGLEFKAVTIIGVEDGLIPHTRSLEDGRELEEERRLLFVGITRAEERLCMSYARNRTVHGYAQATIRSEFLRGLDSLEFEQADQVEYERDLVREQADDDVEPDPYEFEELEYNFRVGQLIRHPSLGIGKIVEALPSRENSRVVVQFKSGARKTLVLKYARLEPLDYD